MNESGKISTVVITYSSGNSKTNNSKSLEVICENKGGNWMLSCISWFFTKEAQAEL